MTPTPSVTTPTTNATGSNPQVPQGSNGHIPLGSTTFNNLPALPSLSPEMLQGAATLTQLDALSQLGGHRASNLPPALAASPDAAALLKALKRRWLLAVTSGLLAAVGTALTVWY